MAEVGKEASYSTLDHGRYDFMPLAFDVHGGVAPKADKFFPRLAANAVRNSPLSRRAGILSEVLGPPQQVANASIGGLAQGGGQLHPRSRGTDRSGRGEDLPGRGIGGRRSLV